ncbi:MAG: 3-hydroxyacyl-CoA dehydrogenase NAD-binding domain-containing protein [bacterium]|nr:3-hydroxyacyl-CoA dehydrogenase NAD-binding domain-containing protein [bacterium]
MTLFLDKTTVVGAGLMGSQIGLVLALGSKETILTSRRSESLSRAFENLHRYTQDLARYDGLNGESPETVLTRIRTTTNLEDALDGTQFVVESITEDLESKQSLFQQMDALTPPETLLASNTSGLPITQLAQHVQHKSRIAGSHFVQPGHIVPVVEVIRAEHTSDATMDRIADIWQGLGRLPLRVNHDIPGFLVNRLQHAVIREAVHLLSSGVADAASIDLAFRLGLAPRFTTAGPLEQRDINGLNMHVRVASHLWQTLGGWQEPLAYLKAMVERGETGLEAGKGYYDWSDKDPQTVRANQDEQLLRRTRQVMEDWESSNRQTTSD